MPRYPFKNPLKRFGAALFDFAGNLLFFIPRRAAVRRFQAQRNSFQRILVIRLDHLGDLLMTRPALEALRRRYPQAEIDLLIAAEWAPLFQGGWTSGEVILVKNHWFKRPPEYSKALPEIQALLPKLRQKKYDLAVDFRGDLRNIFLMKWAGIPNRLGFGRTGAGFLLSNEAPYREDLHQVHLNLHLLKALEIDSAPARVPVEYPESRRYEFMKRYESLLASAPVPRIIMHPAAGIAAKQWPSSKFMALLEKISSQNLGHVFIIGTADDKKSFPVETVSPYVHDLRGETSLADLPVLFDLCDLFVGNDSGPGHLAAAQGLECVIIFSGTNRPEIWRPWTEKLYVLDPGAGNADAISSDQVLEVIKKSLAKAGRSSKMEKLQ